MTLVAQEVLHMRRHITRALYAAVAAAVALGTGTFAGTGSLARAATQTLRVASYDGVTGHDAGYVTSGRSFRFVSAWLTVAARTVADPRHAGNGHAGIALSGRSGIASIGVAPGGGVGGIWWLASYRHQLPFRLAPRAGDRLALSIYYDQHGHTYFTAADITLGATQTVRVTVGDVIYSQASLTASVDPAVTLPPATDTRLWQFTGCQVTTDRGDRGTLTGPWTTSALIDTSTGTSAGRVAASPSALPGGGADFDVWLRAVPVTYRRNLAGYRESNGPFRFISTTMTLPSAQTPAGNSGPVLVQLVHNGGPAPWPAAMITVLPGGGEASIDYGPKNGDRPFELNPAPGDQVRVSIFYDQKGHYFFTAADITQGTTQTVTADALPNAGSRPLNAAQVLAHFDNAAVVPPPADAQIWQFTGSVVTTYRGDRGTILGPWATTRWIDTTDGTRDGAVVADASVLDGGASFSVWLRHR
jgi:hypothetical protein